MEHLNHSIKGTLHNVQSNLQAGHIDQAVQHFRRPVQ